MGGTGCAPTAMAMAFTSILGKEVLPVSIASYLYNNTNTFNHWCTGSDGNAIVRATDYYQVKRTPINSVDEMKRALQSGKIVYGAMGPGKFATYNWNHAIVVYGYSDGYTYALEPLDPSKNGRVSVYDVFSQHSRAADDAWGGAYFYALESKTIYV